MPRALLAPGDLVVWPTSSTTRKSARAHAGASFFASPAGGSARTIAGSTANTAASDIAATRKAVIGRVMPHCVTFQAGKQLRLGTPDGLENVDAGRGTLALHAVILCEDLLKCGRSWASR